MDLNEVIAELRSELETLDRVVDSLEMLAQIRTRTRSNGSPGTIIAAAARRKPQKAAPEMAKVAAASSSS
jgi:hypothetical protein